MTLMFLVIFLVISALVLLAVSLGLKYWETARKRRVSGMLQVASGDTASQPAAALVRDEEEASPVAKMLSSWEPTRKMDAWIKQAGLGWPPEQLLLQAVVFAAMGALLGFWTRLFIFPVWSAVGLACLFGLLPFVHVYRKRRQRLALFEKQFPEALDFMARAMKAGHAFAATLEMLANESPPPLGPEFRKLYDEQNLGAPLETALRKLAQRVPLIDVRFFVSAVLLQRYTGGNLGEILRNLSRVIRERFQLKGQVRAASAHGRITATVLTVLPVLTMLGLMAIAPEYLRGLANDPHGKYLILTALLLLGLGYYFMRRIINIKI